MCNLRKLRKKPINFESYSDFYKSLKYLKLANILINMQIVSLSSQGSILGPLLFPTGCANKK